MIQPSLTYRTCHLFTISTAVDVASGLVTLDAPITCAIETQWGGGCMYKYSDQGRVERFGPLPPWPPPLALPLPVYLTLRCLSLTSRCPLLDISFDLRLTFPAFPLACRGLATAFP